MISSCGLPLPPTCLLLTVSEARSYFASSIRYLGRRHPDADVFRLLERRLRETGSVTATALVNAGRPRTVRTPANEDAVITDVEREQWNSSGDIARQLRLSQTHSTNLRIRHVVVNHCRICGSKNLEWRLVA
jgi:hypothetical protein